MSLSHLPAGQRRKKERGARRWSNHTEASAGRKAHAARRRVRTRRCTSTARPSSRARRSASSSASVSPSSTPSPHLRGHARAKHETHQPDREAPAMANSNERPHRTRTRTGARIQVLGGLLHRTLHRGPHRGQARRHRAPHINHRRAGRRAEAQRRGEHAHQPERETLYGSAIKDKRPGRLQHQVLRRAAEEGTR